MLFDTVILFEVVRDRKAVIWALPAGSIAHIVNLFSSCSLTTYINHPWRGFLWMDGIVCS